MRPLALDQGTYMRHWRIDLPLSKPLPIVVETEPFLRKAKELGFSADMREAIVNAAAKGNVLRETYPALKAEKP